MSGKGISIRRPLSSDGMTDDETSPDQRRNPNVVDDSEGSIGGVLLAAGRSERFEHGNKLLAVIDDEPLVRHSVESLLCSDLDDVVVVAGQDAELVREAIADLDVTVRYNEDYTEGQSASVRVGVEVAQERRWDGAVFALGDMPFVDSATVDRLLAAYSNGAGTIVAAAYEGQRGNPVLFDAVHFDALAAVTGDQGGRRLVQEHEDVVLVNTDDPGVVQDVDYESDLKGYSK